MAVLDEILTGVLTGVVAGLVIAAVGVGMRWYWDYYRPLKIIEWSLPERIELGHVLVPEGAPVPVRLLTIRARNRSSGPLHLNALSVGLRGGLTSKPELSDATNLGDEGHSGLTIPAREFRTIFVHASVPTGSSVRVYVWLWALGYKGRVSRGWILEVSTVGEPTVRVDVKRDDDERALD